MRRLGLGFTKCCGNSGVGRVSVFGVVVVSVVKVGSGWWLEPKSGGWVVLWLCELQVWIRCVDGKSRYLYNVLGGYMCIIDAASVQSC